MRRLLASIFAATLVAALLGPATASAASFGGIFGGASYAGYILVPIGSGGLSVGPLFPASLGCITTAASVSVPGAAVALGTVGNLGTAVDQVTATRTASNGSVQASSTIQNVNLLNGLITATAVQEVANTTADSSSASSNNGSVFTNLTVLGNLIVANGTVAPNTTIALPGIGTVTLNGQSGPINGTDASSIYDNAIDVNLTFATLGLPIGTHIYVAAAISDFNRTAFPATGYADAYALYASGLQGGVTSGPYAWAIIPSCAGGTDTKSLASASVPIVGSVGAMTDTANGQITGTAATFTGSSNILNVGLLPSLLFPSGLISADAVTSTATSIWNGSGGSVSGTTMFTNLRVLGIVIVANGTVAPNTTIPLPGIGYVGLDEQASLVTPTGAAIVVYGIFIHVTTLNLLGLPVGAQIIVARSYASTGPQNAGGAAPRKALTILGPSAAPPAFQTPKDLAGTNHRSGITSLQGIKDSRSKDNRP